MVAVIDDERARVPFSLVAALLLVSSATLAASMGPRDPPTEPAVATGLERTTAEAQTAVRDGALAAGEAAARNPVIDPANTSTGRVLNESGTFRDALRLRVYLAVRERLSRVGYRRDEVRVTASLPATPNASALRAAKRRVDVERAGENGTAMRVRVENVTLTARRHGRVVAQRTASPEMVVATPVLALHDRVAAYQRRLAAPVTDPGLSRRVTAQLYAVAWARGYAQYGGLDVQNVVSNRHVSVATNAALLDLQRRTIGASDANGRRTLAVAAARTGARDALAATGQDTQITDAMLDSPTEPPPERINGLDPPSGPGPETEETVAVGTSAERATLDLLDGDGIEAAVASVYAADARLVARVDGDGAPRPARPERPGENWTLVDADRDVIRSATDATPDSPATPDGWHRLDAFGRTVRVERTRTRTWQRGDETRTTATSASGRHTVSVAVVGRHANGGGAPPGSITTAHERGAGSLDGPNLADVRGRAVDRLVESRGGRDAVARRAASGSLDGDPVRIAAERPAGIRDWLYEDLIDLRGEVRNVSVTVERGRLGTLEADPASELAERVRERREALVDAPERYDSAAAKARAAARARYLDRVVERLEERARARGDQAEGFSSRLTGMQGVSARTLAAGMRTTRRPPATRQPAVDGSGGDVRFQVDAAPSYLTLAELSHEQVPSIEGTAHPLAARNRNAFALPYGEASVTVVDGLFGGSEGVRLSTAARTLRAANATVGEGDAGPRADLARAVADANAHVERRLRGRLAASGIGTDPAERRALVRAATAEWDSVPARALALSNGSATAAIARRAADERGLSDAAADRLRLRLDETRREALSESAARPQTAAVNETRRAVQSAADGTVEQVANETVGREVGRLANESLDGLPSGLPLAPPAYPWVATTNLWHVQVRGEYARFGIRADRGNPTTPGADTVYARDGDPVMLDVDGDGDRERLGRSTRVRFEVSTAIAVVVPPGRTGVGDVDGVRDERSAGWPDAGGGERNRSAKSARRDGDL
ncbi:DUF7286 family protein [Halomicrobium salinisoli]|uniref:DUF7286 family protein n=1 Tax=Halomicrobium salinisoli TaxID=2878391 RepID=UPI001CF06B20|nr:hypothetical protein [Halomicrobium salinisoli]